MERDTFLCGRCEYYISEAAACVVILGCDYDITDGSTRFGLAVRIIDLFSIQLRLWNWKSSVVKCPGDRRLCRLSLNCCRPWDIGRSDPCVPVKPPVKSWNGARSEGETPPLNGDWCCMRRG